ncbi:MULTISPECIES: CvpA family protein [Candidatus Cardinium]|uniref:CvpA family protein n=1 Tax=Candidatus Cardinium TaxID=273135 RepID=UPI001FAAD265|nr:MULTISPECIES: CvpA family protein [Cardinium]
MNIFDIILMVPLIWGGYNGFKKGFIVELISSSLLVLGCIKGVTLFYTLLPIIENKVPPLATFLPICLAILMLFIGVLIIYLLTKLIKGMLMITLLGMFDNLLGGLFGLCKVAFFISLLIYCCGCLDFAALPKYCIDNSLLFPLLEPIVPKILQSFTSIDQFYPLKHWGQLKSKCQ